MDEKLAPESGDALDAAVQAEVLATDKGDLETPSEPSVSTVEGADQTKALEDKVDGLYSQFGDLKTDVTETMTMVKEFVASQSNTQPTEGGAENATSSPTEETVLETPKEDDALKMSMMTVLVNQLPEVSQLKEVDPETANRRTADIINSIKKHNVSVEDIGTIFEIDPGLKQDIDTALIVSRARAKTAPAAEATATETQAAPTAPISNRPSTVPVTTPPPASDGLGGMEGMFGPGTLAK